MRHIDPYAPIEKRRLMTADGMTSKGYTIRLADPKAASGWSEVGLVSEDYLLVSNEEVRDMAQEIAARSGLAFREDKVFFDGKRYAYGLVAREKGLVDVSAGDAAVGDAVGIGLLFQNSYDGSTRLSASLYVHRLACSNGMVVPKLFQRVTFKHTRRNRDWEGEVERSMAMLGSAPAGLQRFAEAARRLSEMRLTPERLREVRTEVLPRLPVTWWGKTMDRLLQHETLDGFGLLNAGTNVLWHDERPSASSFAWNEYVTSGLVEHALGEAIGDAFGTRRN